MHSQRKLSRGFANFLSAGKSLSKNHEPFRWGLNFVKRIEFPQVLTKFCSPGNFLLFFEGIGFQSNHSSADQYGILFSFCLIFSKYRLKAPLIPLSLREFYDLVPCFYEVTAKIREVGVLGTARIFCISPSSFDVFCVFRSYNRTKIRQEREPRKTPKTRKLGTPVTLLLTFFQEQYRGQNRMQGACNAPEWSETVPVQKWCIACTLHRYSG